MAGRLGRAPPTHRQQLAPKRLRDAHGDGESYRKEVTTEVALTSIIVMVVHVVMVMVIVVKATESPYGLRLTTYDGGGASERWQFRPNRTESAFRAYV